MTIEISDMDFGDAAAVNGFLSVLREYSQGEGAGNQGIPPEKLERLPNQLVQFPTAKVVIASEEGNVVGIAVCIRGFSTFKAKPILNIHDLAVLRSHRGQGIGKKLIDAVKARAEKIGCCKVTLEVIESNEAAHRLYTRQGFRNPTNDARSLFLEYRVNSGT